MSSQVMWNKGNTGALALEFVKSKIRMHGDPFKLDPDIMRIRIWELAEERGISYDDLAHEVEKVLYDLIKESEKAIEGIRTPPDPAPNAQ